jgi:hypothetical protein
MYSPNSLICRVFHKDHVISNDQHSRISRLYCEQKSSYSDHICRYWASSIILWGIPCNSQCSRSHTSHHNITWCRRD